MMFSPVRLYLYQGWEWKTPAAARPLERYADALRALSLPCGFHHLAQPTARNHFDTLRGWAEAVEGAVSES